MTDATRSIPPIDVPTVVALLEEVVAEKGEDYRYDENTCVYFRTNTDRGKSVKVPLCIVGHVLARVGKLDGAVAEDNEDAINLNTEGFTPQAAIVLSKAQATQDEQIGELGYRQTWGEALRQAKKTAEKYL